MGDSPGTTIPIKTSEKPIYRGKVTTWTVLHLHPGPLHLHPPHLLLSPPLGLLRGPSLGLDPCLLLLLLMLPLLLLCTLSLLLAPLLLCDLLLQLSQAGASGFYSGGQLRCSGPEGLLDSPRELSFGVDMVVWEKS